MIVKRILIVFFSLLALVIFFLLGTLFVTFKGPSPTARDMLTLSMLETSALKFVPALFITKGMVNKIVEYNSVVESAEITDISLISFRTSNVSGSADDEWADYPDGIRIEKILGGTYRGYVMLIRDPSRLYVSTSSDFVSGQPGLRILEVVRRDDAIAGINGGGFPDEGGVGVGDLPIGLVFSKGKRMWGNENTVYSSVIGFDNNDVLIVGNFSVKMAREMGIRDALCFGPTLVINGEPMEIKGLGGGLNPRSAIGQRSDGSVILLCVEGRMSHSLGASFSDLIEVMLRYGAVNASNLDGGTSTTLVYNNELVNVFSNLYGPRRIPTFFMVRKNEININ
ncbi:MAG: phosphodiester glycosidase family protein [Treponema sp.]|nr:phosphodiester glycosidase family protein [Treponema sp.]MCL2250697.1 phosphodiester glycosidase family protein [Treponema sp.]